MRFNPVDFLRHRRIILFWVGAIAGLIAPWLIRIDIPGQAGQTGTGDACTVASIYDGDTVRATCGGAITKIRLYCVDTPEIAQAPWGLEARDHLRKLAPAHTAITLKRHEVDRYGRTIGEISAGGLNLNLEQVKAGMAAVYPQYCKDARFFDAEKVAKAAKLGIWATPGPHQTPWTYRASKR